MSASYVLLSSLLDDKQEKNPKQKILKNKTQNNTNRKNPNKKPPTNILKSLSSWKMH